MANGCNLFLHIVAFYFRRVVNQSEQFCLVAPFGFTYTVYFGGFSIRALHISQFPKTLMFSVFVAAILEWSCICAYEVEPKTIAITATIMNFTVFIMKWFMMRTNNPSTKLYCAVSNATHRVLNKKMDYTKVKKITKL